MKEDKLSDFTLVGGTALALQIGHRISVDIDLFTDHSFESKEILEALRKTLKVELIMSRPNGMQLIVENLKVDLYNWAVPFIGEPYISNGLRLASLKDIAAFKLDAITTRKTKKDYYDLYFLLDRLTLEEMIKVYKEKYPYNSSKNVIVGLSSCSASDNDEQPDLLKPVSWIEVKARLINEVQHYEKNIIVQKESQIKEREENIKQLLQKKRDRKI
jgi:predicted nucleotidyltransferase component of viral defense system